MKNDNIPPNPHPVKPPPNLPKPRTESLEAENARLKTEVERLGAFRTHTIIPNEILQAENARLKAENARLRKAGDAVCESPYLWEDDPAVIEWRAAKEGKQP